MTPKITNNNFTKVFDDQLHAEARSRKDFFKVEVAAVMWLCDEGGENPLITVLFVEPSHHLSSPQLLHIQKFFFQYFARIMQNHMFFSEYLGQMENIFSYHDLCPFEWYLHKYKAPLVRF